MNAVFQKVLDEESIDTNSLFEHPFKLLAQIKSSELKDIIQFQSHDDQFISAFFNFFVEQLINRRQEISELDKCFFVGRVKAIPQWIQRTKQKFNIFSDYDELDRIFSIGVEALR